MKRGDVVRVATGSGFGGKPRPALVVQADEFDTPDTVIVALFTSEVGSGEPARPTFDPSAWNVLREKSSLMVDIVVTARRWNVSEAIGRLSREELVRAERALLTALGFASDPRPLTSRGADD